MRNPTPGSAAAAPETRLVWTLFLLTTGVLLLPILAVGYVPLVDLPGHLGRLHILWNYAGTPEFQQRYELVLKPIPDLALDLFTPLLAWLSMQDLARVFVAVMIAVFSAGIAMLSRSIHGRITPCAVLALFAQYNSCFFYGFVVFQFSAGLYLITLALWYQWRDRWTLLRVGALAAMAAGVYLAHLGGFVFLAISILWLTVVKWILARRINVASLIGLMPLGIPVLLYLFERGPGGSGNAARIEWSSVALKLRHFLALLIGYNGAIDIVVVAVLMLAAGLVLGFGRVRIQREIGSLAALFWLIFLISPNMFLTGSDADTRFVIPAGVLTLVALRVEISRKAGRIAFATAMAALLFRIAFIGWVWTGQDRLIADNVSLFDQIPRHARVYPIFTFESDVLSAHVSTGKFERPLYHAISWATVNRDAIVPTTFTIRGQHSVAEHDGYWFQEYSPLSPSSTFDSARVYSDFDVIWYFGADESFINTLEQQCELIGVRGKSRLYQIKKLAGPSYR